MKPIRMVLPISVQVRLNISGGYNGDLHGFLVLNNGTTNTTAILLNRIGKDEANPYGSSDLGSSAPEHQRRLQWGFARVLGAEQRYDQHDGNLIEPHREG